MAIPFMQPLSTTQTKTGVNRFLTVSYGPCLHPPIKGAGGNEGKALGSDPLTLFNLSDLSFAIERNLLAMWT